MNKRESEAVNQSALALLGEGAFYKAQELFRQNAKKHPEHMTLNNLGVFYLNEGMELADGRIRGAEKLGLRYLTSASARGQSRQNLAAAGTWYFKKHDYKTALTYFEKAAGLGESYDVCSDLGACRFLLGDRTGAVRHFEKALSLCDNDEDTADILLSYAFALLPDHGQQCLDVLSSEKQSLFRNPPYEFVLFYQCGELQKAAANIRQIVDEYAVAPPIVAMIFDCLIRLGKESEARVILDMKIEDLEDFNYDMTPEIGAIRRAFESPADRAALIGEFLYQPPIIEPCCYIGCPTHDPAMAQP